MTDRQKAFDEMVERLCLKRAKENLLQPKQAYLFRKEVLFEARLFGLTPDHWIAPWEASKAMIDAMTDCHMTKGLSYWEEWEAIRDACLAKDQNDG